MTSSATLPSHSFHSSYTGLPGVPQMLQAESTLRILTFPVPFAPHLLQIIPESKGTFSHLSIWIHLSVLPKRTEGGRERRQTSSIHTDFSCWCRETSPADRAMRDWGSGEVRGQLTVSAWGSLSVPSRLGVHPFWIMGIASVGSTPVFSLSSRDFLDSEEEWEGAMRSHPLLPFSSRSSFTRARQRRDYSPSMSSFTAWDSIPSIKTSVCVDGPGAWVGGCLRWPFWIKGMTSSLGASEGFTLMWTQRSEIGRVAQAVSPEPQPFTQKKHKSHTHPQPHRSCPPFSCYTLVVLSLDSLPHTNSFFFFFWLHLVTCEIVVPQPVVKPRPPAVKIRSPNHWTTREPSLPTS